MKTILFQLSFVFCSYSLYAQGSVCKPNKSSLQVQGGYAIYVPQFQGEYLSVGYKYKYHKFLYLNTQFLLMMGKNGTYNNHFLLVWPNVQIKNISIGTSGECKFFKKQSVEVGVGMNAAIVTKSIGTDIQVASNEIFYGPFKTTTWGYHGSLAYFYHISPCIKTGIACSKIFINHNRLTPPYRLDAYGLVLHLSF